MLRESTLIKDRTGHKTQRECRMSRWRQKWCDDASQECEGFLTAQEAGADASSITSGKSQFFQQFHHLILWMERNWFLFFFFFFSFVYLALMVLCYNYHGGIHRTVIGKLEGWNKISTCRPVGVLGYCHFTCKVSRKWCYVRRCRGRSVHSTSGKKVVGKRSRLWASVGEVKGIHKVWDVSIIVALDGGMGRYGCQWNALIWFTFWRDHVNRGCMHLLKSQSVGKSVPMTPGWRAEFVEGSFCPLLKTEPMDCLEVRSSKGKQGCWGASFEAGCIVQAEPSGCHVGVHVRKERGTLRAPGKNPAPLVHPCHPSQTHSGASGRCCSRGTPAGPPIYRFRKGWSRWSHMFPSNCWSTERQTVKWWENWVFLNYMDSKYLNLSLASHRLLLSSVY